jgi:hypothetical protein
MGGNGESVSIWIGMGESTPTTTSVTLAFCNQAGAAITNSAVRCLWQAFPAT